MPQYKLRLSSLDKDALKQSFVDFLKTTSEFTNFNVNASGMASLLDLLAYNSYYQSLAANFLYNETFIDTATKRQNVVSRAVELGYSPYSSRSAKATVQVTVTNVTGNPTTLVLPTNSAFSTTVGNQSFNFVTLYPYSTNIQYDSQNTPFYQFTIDIYEGLLSQITASYVANTFVKIPTLDLDTTSLRVFATIDNTEYEFYQPGNFLTVTSLNKVYYLDEGFNGYNIMFGNNVFGYQPIDSTLIRCLYLISSGVQSNGAGVFSFSSTIPGAASAIVSTTTLVVASGGADKENSDSIKINSTGLYKTQDRAVIPDDYKALILQSSNNIKDVLVWGGENAVPKLFGKVVACIRPRYGDSLTLSEKSNIQTIISAKSVANKGLVFKDPQYLNLIVDTNVTYDSKVITQSVYDLETLIKNTISVYVDTNLNIFNGNLRYSNLISDIDRVDSSIISNDTKLYLKKKFYPTLYQNMSIVFSFNNALDHVNKSFAVKSSLFYVVNNQASVWIEDDSLGNLNLFYSKNGVKTYAGYNIGTIDYNTGNLSVQSILITGLVGTTIDFIAEPSSQDLFSINETIIELDSADIIVSTTVNT